MSKTIKTKFGNARLLKGYYIISSRNENRDKLLHRLIYEDHYRLTILKGNVVHHIDGNKTNNEISNLKLMSVSAHSKLHNQGEAHHNYGKSRPEETCKKISESHKGEKNPFYGKHHSEKTKKQISDNLKGRQFSEDHKKKISLSSFEKHRKYTLWNAGVVLFDKRRCNGVSIKKCFVLVVNTKRVKIGSFIDFLTPQIIFDLIKEEI